MKLIPCPLNGLRPENEFSTAGAIRRQPPPVADSQTVADDARAAWSDYLFLDDNTPARVWEWWCHLPSGFWFAACRDTQNDEIVETTTVEKIQQQLGLE